jgi:hypothetical protein
MSIAAAKRRRKQIAKGNRHLAKIGRPGVPKKISASKSARRLAMLIAGEKKRAQNKNQSKG